MKKTILVVAVMLALFLIGLTCVPSPHDSAHEVHLLEKIKAHQNSIDYAVDSVEIIDTAAFLKVHSDLDGIADFFTENRASVITSFPCTNCHNQSLTAMQLKQNPAVRKAHWNIHLVHADKNSMNCVTCHAKNNMDQLVTLTGQLIHIDESFKLCGQCHSTQYKDWQGGAHGKALTGWKPPRVAKTCVSCHNPHQPAFPSRFPARLNTKQLGE